MFKKDTKNDYFYFKPQDLSENTEKKDFKGSHKITTWRHVHIVTAGKLRKYSSYVYKTFRSY